MEFKQYNEKCLVNNTYSVLRFESLNDIPEKINKTWFENEKIDTLKNFCYRIMDGKIINGIGFFKDKECIICASDAGTALFDKEMFLPFINKTSKLFLIGNDKPIVIKNEDYCIIIAPLKKY